MPSVSMSASTPVCGGGRVSPTTKRNVQRLLPAVGIRKVAILDLGTVAGARPFRTSIPQPLIIKFGDGWGDAVRG